jgi:hypothetical protein
MAEYLPIDYEQFCSGVELAKSGHSVLTIVAARNGSRTHSAGRKSLL